MTRREHSEGSAAAGGPALRREAPDLSRLATPASPPWTARRYPVADPDPRDDFRRDRDRIVHSQAFRRLQHKTQVYIIHEGDFYRTRLTHTLEVAQIARTLATGMRLTEPLAEAIALGHDVGHVPFGHAGERALDELVKRSGDPSGWDSNRHSLVVVDELEQAYPQHPGLNLTFAVRQGIARHETPFDQPVTGFDEYPQPTPEAQVVNLADLIAYCAHDLEDAVAVGLVTPERLLGTSGLDVWRQAWERALAEMDGSPLAARLGDGEQERLVARRARRHLIDRLIWDVWEASAAAAARLGVTTHAEAVRAPEPVIRLSPEVQAGLRQILDFLVEHVYESPMVRRQNFRGRYVLSRLFEVLSREPDLLPRHLRSEPPSPRTVAYYLASLTDRGAVDLFQELFDPGERILSRHRA
ncbi:dGTP triphosphohydrolase [Geochorda subterranea]|uniref:Deoxyguanosinetriphosphate triphosphohydrolase-like protein n=1 Tax=Geochorda subterranea TaxID=3109564 RepID=A0ABZ1BS97_9FIRM|nr:dNTP triphosphohydrolase [Limnochorda sp. LNt]WRP15488.1 dNTP triphosphohydrolase [Limnochorda sp. LNt]